MTDDQIDRELLPVFLEEGKALLIQIGDALQQLPHVFQDRVALSSLRCAVHTIKGSARMAGALAFGQHWHAFEAMIEDALVHQCVSETAMASFMTHYQQAVCMFDALTIQAHVQEHVLASKAISDVPHSGAEHIQPVTPPAYLRLRAQVLDQLLNDAGEIAIASSHVDNHIGRLHTHIEEMAFNIGRVDKYVRAMCRQAACKLPNTPEQHHTHSGFDALEMAYFTQLDELSNMLSESVGDITALHKSLLHAVSDVRDAATRQTRLTRALQNDIMAARMVRVKSIQDRLQRVVRQTGGDVGKDVMLEIRGQNQKVDRSVLERITIVLEHLLRNAVVHGIEHRLMRLDKGKSGHGHIVVDVVVQGNALSVHVRDDGQGIDLTRLKAQAVRCGVLDENDDMHADHVLQCLTHPGLSTSDTVTQSAGRGVGMDAVYSEIIALGGRLDVETVAGKGTTFAMELPLKLAVTPVVLIKQAEASYAIPSLYVMRVLAKAEVMQGVLTDGGTFDWQGERIPVVSFARLIQADDQTGDTVTDNKSALMLRNGKAHFVILVDAILGNKEVVTKPLSPALSRVNGILGATILGAGEIVLIVHPARMMSDAMRVTPIPKRQHPLPRKTATQILVVDDSLTVRRVMSALLTRHGYTVFLAKDGMDALLQLQTQMPDIALIDVEMPRMHGLRLLEKIRASVATTKLPVVMITARTSQKHRDRATALGANAYLGKPCQEEVLLAVVAELTASNASFMRR